MADGVGDYQTDDWSKLTDPEIFTLVSFPLVQRDQLEESLNRLVAASRRQLSLRTGAATAGGRAAG